MRRGKPADMGKGRGRGVTGGEYLLWGVWGGGRAMGFMVGQVAYQRARGPGGDVRDTLRLSGSSQIGDGRGIPAGE